MQEVLVDKGKRGGKKIRKEAPENKLMMDTPRGCGALFRISAAWAAALEMPQRKNRANGLEQSPAVSGGREMPFVSDQERRPPRSQMAMPKKKSASAGITIAE